MFLNLKSLFFDTIFFEKITKFLRGWVAFFVKKFTLHLSQGEIALKIAFFCEFCEKFKLLISLDWRLLEVFWDHIWTSYVFWVFATKIFDFWFHFFGKIIMFLRGSQAFPVINFRSPFPRRIPLLNFKHSDFWEKLNFPYLLINSS